MSGLSVESLQTIQILCNFKSGRVTGLTSSFERQLALAGSIFRMCDQNTASRWAAGHILL